MTDAYTKQKIQQIFSTWALFVLKCINLHHADMHYDTHFYHFLNIFHSLWLRIYLEIFIMMQVTSTPWLYAWLLQSCYQSHLVQPISQQAGVLRTLGSPPYQPVPRQWLAINQLCLSARRMRKSFATLTFVIIIIFGSAHEIYLVSMIIFNQNNVLQ